MFIPEQTHKHMTHNLFSDFFELEQFSTNSYSTSLIWFGDISLISPTGFCTLFVNLLLLRCISTVHTRYGMLLTYISSKFTKSVTYPKISQPIIQVWFSKGITDLKNWFYDISSSYEPLHLENYACHRIGIIPIYQNILISIIEHELRLFKQPISKYI